MTKKNDDLDIDHEYIKKVVEAKLNKYNIPLNDNNIKEQTNFQELLPFYINKTLGEEDNSFMKSYLAKHPIMQKEVNEEQEFANLLKSSIQKENTAIFKPNINEVIKKFREEFSNNNNSVKQKKSTIY